MNFYILRSRIKFFFNLQKIILLFLYCIYAQIELTFLQLHFFLMNLRILRLKYICSLCLLEKVSKFVPKYGAILIRSFTNKKLTIIIY